MPAARGVGRGAGRAGPGRGGAERSRAAARAGAAESGSVVAAAAAGPVLSAALRVLKGGRAAPAASPRRLGARGGLEWTGLDWSGLGCARRQPTGSAVPGSAGSFLRASWFPRRSAAGPLRAVLRRRSRLLSAIPARAPRRVVLSLTDFRDSWIR